MAIGAHEVAVHPDRWWYYERRYDGHVIIERSDTVYRRNAPLN